MTTDGAADSRPKLVRIDTLSLDRDRVDEGIWFNMADGWRYKTRSTSYQPFRDYVDRMNRKNQQRYGRKGVPPDVARRQSLDGLCEHLFVDWEGLADANGNPLAAEPEVVRNLFGNPDFTHLYIEALEKAEDLESFKRQQDAEDLGN